MKIELVLKTMETGCIIPTSHKLNKDGYFRKVINGKWIMYHRYVWIEENGEIPKGYEVDHKCKNRACCNVEHLQTLTSSEHRTKDNTGRNGSRKAKAKEYLKEHPKTTVSTMAGLFNVSFGTIYDWKKQWKEII